MNVNQKIKELVEHSLKMAYIDNVVSGKTSSDIISAQTTALFKTLSENNLHIMEIPTCY